MRDGENLTVSFVSGKGGVGKTMLAVALARELSVKSRILLFDLDFFNRGLTGLMRHGTTGQPLTPPDFLISGSNDQELTGPWALVEVAPNLFHVGYPDLSPDEIRKLEDSDAADLARVLHDYIEYLRAASKCDVIILDCHGGPDQLSFAACLASNYSLLVSEPDRITFYGTLHFIRQLERVSPAEGPQPNLRLVFNKLVSGFSVPYLTRFYDSTLRQYFNDNPLLALFPLELYLTKEFERTPFLTAVYPFSLLAKKTRILAYDLFSPGHRQYVPPSVVRTLGLRRWLTRHSLGRVPAIVDPNFIMRVIAVCAIIFFALTLPMKIVVVPAREELAEAVRLIEVEEFFQQNGKFFPPACRLITGFGSDHCLQERLAPEDYVHATRLLEQSHIIWLYPHITDYLDNHPWRDREIKLLQNPDGVNSTDPIIRENCSRISQIMHRRFMKELLTIYDRYYFSSFEIYDQPFWWERSVTELLVYAALVWLVIAIIINWCVSLDRIFTYNTRILHSTSAFLTFIGALLFLCLPLLFVGGIGSQLWSLAATQLVGLAPVTAIVLDQSLKAYYNLRFERKRAEGFARLLLSLYIIGLALVLPFILHRNMPLLYWSAN